jgi:predicted metal-dependent peptidase
MNTKNQVSDIELQRMQKARAGLITSEPFFGTLATKLTCVADPKAKSTWTDGKYLGFNPEWTMSTAMPQLEATMAHHVLSCAWGHHLRRGSRDRKLWQEASDYVVNLELQRAGFRLPEGSLIDPKYAGMHVEGVYRELDLKRQQGGKQEGEQTGSGAPQGGGGAGGKGQPQPKGGKAPQSAQDEPQKGDSGASGDGATGTVEDASDDAGDGSADPAEKAQQETEWQEAVAQAAQIARGCGKLPGSLERGVENFLHSKVDWREALQRLVQARSKDDYNWSKPNRRFLSTDLYLPTLDSPSCDVLAWAIDLSGSIKQEEINQFVSEVEHARSMLKPKKTVIMGFDTVVREFFEFEHDDPIVVRVKAGGGTAFDDPVAELERRDIKPEILVYLTDLDSRVFPPEPGYPVVWVSTLKEAAPFGEVIMMR